MSRPAENLALIAVKRERVQREQSALDALNLTGRTADLPLDVRKLAVIVHEMQRELAELRRPLRERVRAVARRALGGAT